MNHGQQQITAVIGRSSGLKKFWARGVAPGTIGEFQFHECADLHGRVKLDFSQPRAAAGRADIAWRVARGAAPGQDEVRAAVREMPAIKGNPS
jgi:hypothetical protein